MFGALPPKQGLYDPAFEKDACGVGFIVNIDGSRNHEILRRGQVMLERMNHRGACGGDNKSGDGAGVLTGIPDSLFRQEMSNKNIDLPPEGQYATGILFVDREKTDEICAKFDEIVQSADLKLLTWRDLRITSGIVGDLAQQQEPAMRQPFVTWNEEKSGPFDAEAFARKVYLVRKYATHQIEGAGYRFYICSLSSTTIVYKGQFTTYQLWHYFKDLSDPDFRTHIALVHSRFSTNTFPSWERAHPQRMLAHNGEINTLRGNINLMRAREGVMSSPKYGSDLTKLYPVIEPGMSDSGCVDNALEFLCLAGGRSLPEAVITMVPEAWHNDKLMSESKKAFYAWAAYGMEPWDGPALLTFSDGRFVGAILDRNGLRPARYYLGADNTLYMSSEVGVVDIPDTQVLQKGRLQAGHMLLVDTHKKLFVDDATVKEEIAALRPTRTWLQEELNPFRVFFPNTRIQR